MRARTVLNVNGTKHDLAVDPQHSLLEVLHDRLDLTGTKYGCGEGQCGACTVLLDDAPTRACLTPVAAAGDKPVRTIEGIAVGDELHPVQQAFLDAGALQCGYCTPGMIVAATALLTREPSPTRASVATALQGHLCRCGCYPQIVDAVLAAASARPAQEDRR